MPRSRHPLPSNRSTSTSRAPSSASSATIPRITAHYRAIQHIPREAPKLQPRALTGWIRTSYHPKAPPVLLIKTSYPSRACLEFALDDTRYVTLRNVEPAVMPAD